MRNTLLMGLFCLGTGLGLGYSLGTPPETARGDSNPPDVLAESASEPAGGTTTNRPSYELEAAGETYLKQGAGVVVETDDYDYELGPNHFSKLKPYPQPCLEGMRTPFDIWEYAGRGRSSWGSPRLRMPWEEWVEYHKEMKPQLMADVREYMAGRFDFHGRSIPGEMMSGRRKPIPAGPVARLPEGVESWEALAAMSPEEIREKNLFPYKPLAHPSHSTAHMLFPQKWVEAHPEHERIDLDFDIPDEYLPEFPLRCF
jgi:hypothetical protein